MNTELLMGEFEVTENPGIDTIDPRFGDINTLIQDGNYADGAARAEEIIREGIYDIRLIGYFLYGVFLEQGVGGLAAVFQCLPSLLRENWEAVGPVKKREKHYQTSLKWFVNQLYKKIKYEEDKSSDIYTAWVEQVSSDNVQETLDAIDVVQPVLSQALEDLSGDVTDGLTKMRDWLVTFQKLVYKEPEPDEEIEDTEETVTVEEEEDAQKPIVTQVSTGFSMGGDIAAEGSYHLQMLMNKLSAFEQLIQSEKFALATLVADDINGIVAKFDPKLYFPKLFANFALLFARHISELISFEQNKKSVEWAALKELYKVDLESFVAFDGDIAFSDSVAGGFGGEAGQTGEHGEEEYGNDNYD